MLIQAVLFDLDGTLLDRRGTFRRHLQLQVQRLGELFPAVDIDAIDRMVMIDDNGALPRDEFYRQVETEFCLPRGASSRLLQDFEAHFPETCIPATNLYAALGVLRNAGLKLGLITNGSVLIQGRKIDGLGIRRFLDIVVISESAGIRKPDPRIFAQALTQLEISPSAAAYVGDNPEVDIVGARRSGLVAIWKRDNFWTEPNDADCVIDDLADLPPFVLGSRSPANVSES